MIYFKMEIGVPQEVTILRGNAEGTFNKYATIEEAEKIAKNEADKAVANQKFKTINGNDIRGEGNIEIQGGGTAGVNSINGQSGDLKLKTINNNDLLGEGNIEIQGGGDVTSVNGQKGDVVIDIPSKVSELDNDANYATRSEIPTRVSQLENDKKYQTLTETETKINEAVKDKVDSEKINSIWVGTETEYDKINPKNEKILYVII